MCAVRHDVFNGGGGGMEGENFSVMKVSMHYPLVFLVKAVRREGKVFESGKGRVLKSKEV
jgi:hypothetical protein